MLILLVYMTLVELKYFKLLRIPNQSIMAWTLRTGL